MIIDTPAGNNAYLHQALNVADIVLVVVQPDAACLGTLDQMEALLAMPMLTSWRNSSLPTRWGSVSSV